LIRRSNLVSIVCNGYSCDVTSSDMMTFISHFALLSGLPAGNESFRRVTPS
jgi:hypothetical protein